MSMFLEPGRHPHRPEPVPSFAAGLLLAAALLVSRAATAGEPEDAPLPSLSGVQDPGPRGGSPGAGGPLPGLTASELALFNEGQFRASELEATCDTCSDVPPGTRIPPGSPPDTTNSAGLGGRFNSNSHGLHLFRKDNNMQPNGVTRDGEVRFCRNASPISLSAPPSCLPGVRGQRSPALIRAEKD